MKNEFIKSIIMLLSGSLAAQFFAIITTPVKTRLFTAEDIGLFTYITTIVGIFTPAVMGQYEAVIVLVKRHVYSVIKLCLILCVIFTCIITLCTVGYYLFNDGLSENLTLIIYMPACLLTTGIINILSAYNNRCREYKLFAKINVIRSITNLIGVTVLGFMGTGYIGLLIVALVSQLVALRKQAESLSGHIHEIYLARNRLLFIIAKQYWQQPFMSMPGTFINTLSYSLIAVCVKTIYDDLAMLGYYSMSMMLLGLPLGIVSSNVSKVFFEEAVREKNNTGKFSYSFFRTTKYLLLGTIPIFILMYMLAPWGCKTVLGTEWEVTGIYIRYLVPMFAIRFIVSPLTLTVIISQKQYYNLIIQTLFLISLGCCYCITINNQLSVEEFLNLINWSYAFVYVFFWIMCRRLSREG